MGFQPPVWLRAGDVIELGVEGLGQQRQRVVGPT
jgi:2-keto-4-pentenoate hydratase/2-oxohepta-3-ene-1,7-dioic acid hydratase in catechol pathway